MVTVVSAEFRLEPRNSAFVGLAPRQSVCARRQHVQDTPVRDIRVTKTRVGEAREESFAER